MVGGPGKTQALVAVRLFEISTLSLIEIMGKLLNLLVLKKSRFFFNPHLPLQLDLELTFLVMTIPWPEKASLEGIFQKQPSFPASQQLLNDHYLNSKWL